MKSALSENTLSSYGRVSLLHNESLATIASQGWCVSQRGHVAEAGKQGRQMDFETSEQSDHRVDKSSSLKPINLQEKSSEKNNQSADKAKQSQNGKDVVNHPVTVDKGSFSDTGTQIYTHQPLNEAQPNPSVFENCFRILIMTK
ncbi:hypothetical protein RJT34_27413 [Clitoria ternatea]|uniref:Uncharacterized protein n=1 Tax=Clitoria ternatea TaxID=43366 RepID=A0AAN9FGH4_CLITE